MYPIMRNMDSTLYVQGDAEAAATFFTLEHVIRHYRCAHIHVYMYVVVYCCVFVVVVVVCVCVCVCVCVHMYRHDMCFAILVTNAPPTC